MNKINSTRANPGKERGVALVTRFHCRSILFHLCGGLHSSALLYVVANVCVYGNVSRAHHTKRHDIETQF